MKLRYLLIISILSLGVFSCEGGCDGGSGGDVGNLLNTYDPTIDYPIKYVAVGGDGGSNNQYIVLTSINGIDWHLGSYSVTPPQLDSIAYDRTKKEWLAVSQAEYTVESNDATNWKEKNQSSNAAVRGLLAVTYETKEWLAVGIGFKALSYDGNIWREIAAGQSNIGLGFRGIAGDGSGNWLAVGDAGNILTSNSSNNTPYQIGTADNMPMFESVAYGDVNGTDTWVAVGNQIWISNADSPLRDRDWTRKKTNLADTLNSVFYGDSKFLAVGNEGGVASVAKGVVYTSTDGINWTGGVKAELDQKLNSVVYNGTDNKWVAVGNDCYIYTSSDGGVSWEKQYDKTMLDQSVRTPKLNSIATQDN